MRLSVSLDCLWWLGDNVVDDYDRLDQTFFAAHRNRIIALKIVDGFWMEFLMTASSLSQPSLFSMMVWIFFRGKRIQQTNTFGSMHRMCVFCRSLLSSCKLINDFSTVAGKYQTQNGPLHCALCKQQLPTLSQLLVDNFRVRKNKKSLKSSIMS